MDVDDISEFYGVLVDLCSLEEENSFFDLDHDDWETLCSEGYYSYFRQNEVIFSERQNIPVFLVTEGEVKIYVLLKFI